MSHFALASLSLASQTAGSSGRFRTQSSSRLEASVESAIEQGQTGVGQPDPGVFGSLRESLADRLANLVDQDGRVVDQPEVAKLGGRVSPVGLAFEDEPAHRFGPRLQEVQLREGMPHLEPERVRHSEDFLEDHLGFGKAAEIADECSGPGQGDGGRSRRAGLDPGPGGQRRLVTAGGVLGSREQVARLGIGQTIDGDRQ